MTLLWILMGGFIGGTFGLFGGSYRNPNATAAATKLYTTPSDAAVSMAMGALFGAGVTWPVSLRMGASVGWLVGFFTLGSFVILSKLVIVRELPRKPLPDGRVWMCLHCWRKWGGTESTVEASRYGLEIRSDGWAICPVCWRIRSEKCGKCGKPILFHDNVLSDGTAIGHGDPLLDCSAAHKPVDSATQADTDVGNAGSSPAGEAQTGHRLPKRLSQL